MADFYSAGTISPMIPVKLISEQDSALFDALNINSEPAGEDEHGNKLVYLFNEDYCSTGYIEVEGEDDKEVSEDDLYEALQNIIKRSEGLLTYITHEQGHTCSKMRPDSHGGSAVFVTADDIRYFGTQSWLQQRINEVTTGDMIAGAEDNDTQPPSKAQVVVFMEGGLVQEVMADTPVDVLVCDLEHGDYDLADLTVTPNGQKCHYSDQYIHTVEPEKTKAHFDACKTHLEHQEYREAA